MAGKRRAHGEGNIRQRPDGRWEARITVGHNPNGTRRRKSVYGKTQAEVRRELNKLASKLDAGEVIAITRAAKLVDFLTAWLEAGAPTARGRKGSLNEKSLQSYTMHIRVHIVPGLGQTRLDALTSPMIQTWVNALPVGSAENICRTLSMALSYAVRQKIITSNPASGLSIPNSGDHKELHKPLDSEEAKRFLKAAEGHRLWALWVLLLGLGMREGEALGVRRRDVDFKQNTVRIRQGKTQLIAADAVHAPVRHERAERAHRHRALWSGNDRRPQAEGRSLGQWTHAVRTGRCRRTGGAEPQGRP